MRLTEYEFLVKSKVKKDIYDPEIYDLLQSMTLMFLRRKRVAHSDKDREDISHIIAADILMKLIDGEEFSYYLGYLEKIYKEYLEKFYEGTKNTVPLDPSIDVNHEILGNPSVFDYYRLNNEVYLKEIYRVLDELMDETCKYKPHTKERLNLKLSLALSILRGEVVGFHLETEQYYYLRMLIVKFYSKVKDEGLDANGNLCIGGTS